MAPPDGEAPGENGMTRQEVSWRVVRSRRRTLELRVNRPGDVEVRAPFHVSDREIAGFVHSRRDWLRRTLQKMEAEPGPIPLGLHDGARQPWRGEALVLALEQGRPKSVQRQGKTLQLRLPQLATDHIARALEQWYRAEARHHFEAAIDRYFPFFAARGHRRPVLRVKRMKSRWGSLSARGYINLNLELVKLPPVCLDYVVAHELCHLEQMNHGPRFHALMDELMPDWPARKHLLDRLPAFMHNGNP